MELLEKISVYTNNSFDNQKFATSVEHLKSSLENFNMNSIQFAQLKRSAYVKYLKAKKELYEIGKTNDKFAYDLKKEEVDNLLKNYIGLKNAYSAIMELEESFKNPEENE